MNEKKNVVLLCGPDMAAVSGVSTHLNQLFESELAKKYALRYFQVGSEGRKEGVALKILRLLVGPLKFALMVGRCRPSIVHLNSSLVQKAYWRDLSFLFVARLARCPVVYQVHGGAPPQKFLGESRIMRAFLYWTLAQAASVVLLAKAEKEKYTEFGKFRRLTVIPNALDLSEYAELETKLFNRECLELGYIGRLTDGKGIKETILAVASLRRAGQDNIRLRIAGSGPIEEELRAIAKAEDVGDVVEFIGAVFGKDKLSFWQGIDLFVFPTFLSEGLPYAVLESLASGTPIITTSVGGIPDVVVDGLHGIIVSKQDVPALSSAIQRLNEDREMLSKMSQSAVDQARRTCGIDRLTREFDDLYEEIITHPRSD